MTPRLAPPTPEMFTSSLRSPVVAARVGLWLGIAFGLCFQLPVLLTLMGRAGIISSQSLVSTRKYAIVAILILAAVATPPDMMSQIILFATVYPLYEVSILLIRRHERKVEAQMRAEGLLDEDESLYDDEEKE